MADSSGSRTLFQTLKVPFDMKAVALAFLGLIVLWAGGAILDGIYESAARGLAEDEWLDKDRNKKPEGEDAIKAWNERKDAAFESIDDRTEINVIPVMIFDSLRKVNLPINRLPVIGDEIVFVVTKLYGQPVCNIPNVTHEPDAWRLGWFGNLIALIWWFLILAIFGGAICRVAACRIARDESICIKDALKFSIKSIRDYLLAPVAVAAVIAFMWACILLAGLVVSIPYIGPFFSVVLYPLVIISGLIITIVGFVGILGLLMMVAAVSTERNGALDAISRAFSYIFSRPLQFFFACFLVFLFAYIILLAGDAFVNVVSDSFASGSVSIELDRVVDANKGSAVHTPEFGDDGFFWGVAALVIWFFHRLLWWGISGYAIYFILGGMTSAYFSLRREVDGTEESELYLEDADEDEFDFSATGTPTEPPPVPEAPAAEAPADDTLALPKEEEAAEAPEVESTEDDEEKKPEGEGDA